MMEITFVTGNKKKAKEAESILGFNIKKHALELDEIQDLDVEKIIKHKAEQAYSVLNKPVFVDDVGMYIDAWNGFPGPFIKWILVSGGCDLLLKMLSGEKNRKAYVKLAIGFCDGKVTKQFNGIVHGKIVTKKKKDSSPLWFDSVFVPDGETRTFSEMSLEEKNKISHRRIALEKFRTFLKKNKHI